MDDQRDAATIAEIWRALKSSGADLEQLRIEIDHNLSQSVRKRAGRFDVIISGPEKDVRLADNAICAVTSHYENPATVPLNSFDWLDPLIRERKPPKTVRIFRCRRIGMIR